MSLITPLSPRRTLLDSVFANRVLDLPISVNRSPLPSAARRFGLPTAVGCCAQTDGLPLTTSWLSVFSLQESLSLPNDSPGPMARGFIRAVGSMPSVALRDGRGLDFQWGRTTSRIPALIQTSSDHPSIGNRRRLPPGPPGTTVRLSPRKAHHEKRDVDQCDPAGRVPDRDR